MIFFNRRQVKSIEEVLSEWFKQISQTFDSI